MNISRFLVVLMGAGLGALVYAGVGLTLAVIFLSERLGWRCPHCRRRTLELVWWLESYPTPSPAYFECTNCRARVRQVRPGPWQDASDPEFDKYYDGTMPGSINTRRARVLGYAAETPRHGHETTLPAESARNGGLPSKEHGPCNELASTHGTNRSSTAGC